MKTPAKDRLVGNVSMIVAKTFSGFNQNALKYLLPRWMNAVSGVFLRLAFGTLFFWVVGWIRPAKKESLTARDRWMLLLTGAVCVAGYMYTLLLGLTYTTPISSSLFIGLQASVVYVICLVMKTESFSWEKIAGIFLGIAGVLICILTQKTSDIASNPMLGNLFCFGSTLLFSIYLIVEKRYLRRLSNATVSKYTFTGALIVSLLVILFSRQWFAPVLSANIFSTPFLVLIFVMVFPSAVSYLLMDVALKRLSATVVALYANWILIVAAITSYILGQDRFSWWQIASILLIIASVCLVERSEKSTKN